MNASTRSIVKQFRRRIFDLLTLAAITAAVFISSTNAYAYFTWEGGDWGGGDLVPANGDILSGTFTNIGRFIIEDGVSVYGGSSLVALGTYETLINGTFSGGAALSPSLDIVSQTSITLGGMLDQWASVSLTGQPISFLPGSLISLISAEGDIIGIKPDIPLISSPIEDPLVNDSLAQRSREFTGVSGGGIIPLSPVPLPSAFLLFGPGLAVAALARRRMTR